MNILTEWERKARQRIYWYLQADDPERKAMFKYWAQGICDCIADFRGNHIDGKAEFEAIRQAVVDDIMNYQQPAELTEALNNFENRENT